LGSKPRLVAKQCEEEMNIKHEKSNGNATYKKSLAISFSAIFNLLGAMDIFIKKRCVTNLFFKQLGLSCCQKPFAFISICYHLVKMLHIEVMPSYCGPFHKELCLGSVTELG
jgi:uncharacterized membrane protein YhdT